ncbi:MAG: serine/threonine protein kinase [Myxococcales bacterium]|nr:serine/threonine protein kinase [Myxococcales bacterium]HQY63220.1 serine/threonine-protein kinase [Polyangiaceae bacterium]
MSAPPAGPEAGTVLAGKYRVERVLGVGGMGVVVAATHVQLEQRVAIKYLLPVALANPEVVERFAREARIAAKLRGPHVARVIDVSQFDDGVPFMVLEYLQGHDLASELENKGPLEVEDAVRYVLEACEALAEAHAAHVVHRDLKPANLFLAVQPDKRAIVKILDFGISRSVEASAIALTGTGTVMGTVYYMSPEQLADPKGIDHRADIWSLGVILYELLTGTQPFTGDSAPAVIIAVLANRPRPILELRALPEGLEEVVARCLREDRGARFQNVAELAAALAPFAAEKDRGSAEIAARVLGVAAEPAPSVGAIEVAAQRVDPKAIATAATVLFDTGVPVAAPSASPAQDATRRPRRALLALGGVGALAVAGVGLFLARGGSGAGAAPIAIEPAHSASSSVGASVASAATPTTARSAAALVVPEPSASAKPTAAPGPKPKPNASGLSASLSTPTPPPVPSVATPPAVTASATPKKNPLEMGLK